jgi:nucleoid-associated protein YgaU
LRGTRVLAEGDLSHRIVISGRDEFAEWVPVLTQHTVRLGDSLSEIAKFYYGKSSNALVELIFRANTDLLDDPDEIFQGDVIRIPVPPT